MEDYSVRTEDAMRMPRPSGTAVCALATHRSSGKGANGGLGASAGCSMRRIERSFVRARTRTAGSKPDVSKQKILPAPNGPAPAVAAGNVLKEPLGSRKLDDSRAATGVPNGQNSVAALPDADALPHCRGCSGYRAVDWERACLALTATDIKGNS